MEFNYKEYFKEFKPKTKEDIINRFIFAICSVHTTWESNVKGYKHIKKNLNKKNLSDVIKTSGLGLNNVREKAIINLLNIAKTDIKILTKRRKESWQSYANRLEKKMFGLGYAKTRFAIELLYPNSAKVCCVDTHIIQWSKQNPNKMNKTLYKKIEQGWLNHSKKQGLNPVEARWKWWDKKQNQLDCRYWTRCLE